MKIKKELPLLFFESSAMGTCDEYVRLLKTDVSNDLIPDTVWSCILLLLKRLPGELVLHSFVLEASLGRSGGPVDFSVHLNKRMRGPDILLSVAKKMSADGDEAWKACHRIAKIWQDKNSALGKYVDDIWLEFDLFSDHPVSPSIFFKTMNAGPGKIQGIFDEAGACITGSIFTDQREKNVGQCMNAVARGGRITWFGIMLPRPESIFRLCLYWPAPQSIPLLKDLAYPFLDDRISALEDQLNRMFKAVCLNVDISESIGNRIGFECFFPPPAYDRDSAARWEEALTEFNARGWCTPEKLSAILKYPGHARLSKDPKAWPGALSEFYHKTRGKMESCFVRQLNHLKIGYTPSGYTPGENLKAKIYLSSTHVWVENSRTT